MDGGEDPMKPTATKLTYDDFLGFPDDGLRHELIDGEHHVTPSPATRHQRIVGELFAALHAYFAESKSGEAFLAPFDVVLSTYDVVEPDLLVILSGQAGILTETHVRLTARRGDVLTSERLPRFSLPLAKVFGSRAAMG